MRENKLIIIMGCITFLTEVEWSQWHEKIGRDIEDFNNIINKLDVYM